VKIKLLLVVIISASISPLAVAGSKKEPVKAGKIVDSGAFGIFVQGRRIGTETFDIEQKSDISIAKAEVKIEDGATKASQNCELKILPNGDLQRYQWKETAPEKAETSVEYKDQFFVQLIGNGSDKPQERAFMLPPSTMILDDNFFSHREILLWRYVASSCGGTTQPSGCRIAQGQFGVFVPHQQSSIMVTMEYKGKERVPVRGTELELDHFTMNTDGVEWALWMDSSFKVQLIQVPSEHVEVVRE
jgi:hypothetical protein